MVKEFVHSKRIFFKLYNKWVATMDLILHMIDHLVADLWNFVHFIVALPYYFIVILLGVASSRIGKFLIKMMVLLSVVIFVVGHIAMYYIAGNSHYGALGNFCAVILRGYCPMWQVLFNSITIVLHRLLGTRPRLIELCCNGGNDCVTSLPFPALIGWILGVIFFIYLITYWKSSGRAKTPVALETILDEVKEITLTLPQEAQQHYTNQASSLLTAVRRERARVG